MGGMNEAVDAAREMAASDDVWLARQFENPANPEAHRRTTAPEILAALDRVDVFVAGVGARGTITRARGGLKARNPRFPGAAREPRAPAAPPRGGPGAHPHHRPCGGLPA